MTGIHDTLQKCRRYLLADRDCVYESVSLDDGTIPDADDAKDVAEIDALIDEIDRVVAQSEWQRIATAPRDGTVVDLWHKDGFRFTDEWWTEDAFWTCLFDDSHFTHWKPITEPEQAQESD